MQSNSDWSKLWLVITFLVFFIAGGYFASKAGAERSDDYFYEPVKVLEIGGSNGKSIALVTNQLGDVAIWDVYPHLAIMPGQIAYIACRRDASGCEELLYPSDPPEVATKDTVLTVYPLDQEILNK